MTKNSEIVNGKFHHNRHDINNDEIILSCDDISKTYENGNSLTNVLKHVSLEIKKESINMIYGKSGKTTLLNILAGIDTISSDTSYQC